MTFLEILEKTLLQDKRFIAEDGKVLKAKVYDAAMAMDEDLLHLLLSEQVLKDHFFKKVNDTFIFDKVEFTWVLNSREFLPDSYTMYKNKIGLVDNSGDLISQKQDVTLVWPYKDCVLEGGQTKDDEKRDEVFYNETLAPDQVTRLLYPKALTNAKRYSYAGNYDLTGKAVGGEGTVTYEETTEFLDDDNLIIKGNNLLALSSLLRRYEGKVKLIYIDVDARKKRLGQSIDCFFIKIFGMGYDEAKAIQSAEYTAQILMGVAEGLHDRDAELASETSCSGDMLAGDNSYEIFVPNADKSETLKASIKKLQDILDKSKDEQTFYIHLIAGGSLENDPLAIDFARESKGLLLISSPSAKDIELANCLQVSRNLGKDVFGVVELQERF
jgi:adenine-specific DNA-methyltransferase